MKIKLKSCFKDEPKDWEYFENWVKQLERANGRDYDRIEIQTSLGKTHVWGLNTQDTTLEALFIFPGARTTALFWDFDQGLGYLNQKLRIFLVETNGLPNLSDGNTPDINSLDYGFWADEVLSKLGITSAFVAGASFGGLIGIKLGTVRPEKVKALFLLNPGCLQPFSLTLRNLYYNILPLVNPSEKNVTTFLEKAVFAKSNHQLSAAAEKLFVAYEVFAIRRYKDNTQKPYYMARQLAEAKVDTYLLLGDKDLLFPYRKSMENAQKHLSQLKEIKLFQQVGHGIETYAAALQYIGEKIKIYQAVDLINQ